MPRRELALAIRNNLEGIFGTNWTRRFGGNAAAKREELRQWVFALERYEQRHIANAWERCLDSRQTIYPPTIPEFVAMVKDEARRDRINRFGDRLRYDGEDRHAAKQLAALWLQQANGSADSRARMAAARAILDEGLKDDERDRTIDWRDELMAAHLYAMNEIRLTPDQRHRVARAIRRGDNPTPGRYDPKTDTWEKTKAPAGGTGGGF